MIALPFISVRNLVVFPGMETALVIGREISVKAIELALKSKDQHLAVISQRQSEQNENVGVSDMYAIGTVCEIEKSVRMDDAMKIFVVGKYRMKVEGIDDVSGVRTVQGSAITAKNIDSPVPEPDRKNTGILIKSWCAKLRDNVDSADIKNLGGGSNLEAYLAKAISIVSHYSLDKKNPDKDIVSAAKRGLGQSYQECFDLNKDTINVMVAGRQTILDEPDPSKALGLLQDLLRREIEMFAET